MRKKVWRVAAMVLALNGAALQPAAASVMAVGVGAFGSGSTLTTFDTLATGVEVNGLVVNGLTFQYSLGNGALVIDGGPGVTNNISPQNVVSIGNNTGALTVLLPTLTSAFGYGYAILANSIVPTATVMALFNGASPVGTLGFSGSPDPTFTGGFAGIQSTLAFDRVQLSFNSTAAPAFALDNIRTVPVAAVPEPTTVFLLGIGLGAVTQRLRRRR